MAEKTEREEDVDKTEGETQEGNLKDFDFSLRDSVLEERF